MRQVPLACGAFLLLGLADGCKPGAGGASAVANPAVGSAASEQQSAPELPSLELAPADPILAEVIARAPAPPDEARMKELRDLLETAYLPHYADARTSALAQRTLTDAEDAAWILEEGLAHDDTTVRMQCAFLLGSGGHKRAIPILLYRTKYERDPNVLVWVCGALHRLENHGGLDLLSSLMNREDSAQQAGATAIEILQACGKDPGENPSYAQLQAGLMKLYRHWRRTGIVTQPAPPESDAPDGLQHGPDPATLADLDAIDPLLAARYAAHLDTFDGYELRPIDDGRMIFIRSGALAVPVLRLTLHAENGYVRNHSTEVARDLGPVANELGDTVLPLLADGLTGSLAARALGEMRYRPALEHLLHRLESPEIEVRASAAGGLARMGAPEAVAPLLARMNDPEELMDVRVQAAVGVARLDPGMAFLRDALGGDGVAPSYHEATLLELIDEVGAWRLGVAESR